MNFPSLLFSVVLVLGGSPQDRFFYALGMQESTLGQNLYGDYCKRTGEYEAVGWYGIHKIYVDDVNKILGKEVFSYADRLDPAKSRRMVCIYLSHYASERRLGRTPTVWDLARIHNGGPNGHRKQSTITYAQEFARYWSNQNEVSF